MQSWNDVIHHVLKLSVHKDVKVVKSTVLNPLKQGFTRSLGDFRGQIADFRRPMPDGKSIHIQEFAEHFLVHWDWRDPSLDPIGHLVQDAPHILIISSLVALTAFVIVLGFRGEKG